VDCILLIMTDWTFISDEAPPRDTDVLVSDGKEVCLMSFWQENGERQLGYSSHVTEMDFIIEPTKWMHLPKP